MGRSRGIQRRSERGLLVQPLGRGVRGEGGVGEGEDLTIPPPSYPPPPHG